MKKLFVIILTLILLLSLASCKNDECFAGQKENGENVTADASDLDSTASESTTDSEGESPSTDIDAETTERWSGDYK